MKKINDRLMELVKDLNLNQREFADKIGIKSNTFSMIKQGKKKLTDRNIKLICTMFNVNEKWLREGEEPKYLDKIKFDLIKEIMSENNYLKLELINKLIKEDIKNLNYIYDLIINDSELVNIIFNVNKLSRKNKEKLKNQIEILL